MPTIKEEGGNGEIIEDKKEEMLEVEEERKEARKIVLNHLVENYKLKEWGSISLDGKQLQQQKKEQIEQDNSLTKEEDLKRIRNEIVKDIKSGLSAELSTLRKLTLVIEQNTQK